MKDDKAIRPIIGIILMTTITIILAAVIAVFVFNMGSSLTKNNEEMPEFNNETNISITYFNTSNSTDYQNAFEITHLEYVPFNNFIVNNETISEFTQYIIEDNETQKFLNKTITYEECNENVIIGDKECELKYTQEYIIFIHQNVSEAIIPKINYVGECV